MSLLLIDNRNRLASHKREVRAFPDTFAGYGAAWKVVLDAEVKNETDRNDYCPAEDTTRRYWLEVFNGFWSCYGWELERPDTVVWSENNPFPTDMVFVSPPETPAPTCFA